MSHYKENMGNNASSTIKMEPTEVRLPPASALNPSRSTTVNVKTEANEAASGKLLTTQKKESDTSQGPKGPEPESADVPMDDLTPATNASATIQRADPNDYIKYSSADDIDYTPEHALQQGLKMVNTMASKLKGLQLGPRRQEVWLREIASLRSQSAPSTLIAICGATGAGKSSTLNAILDDNIVPTSGMRACTAVVTEIAYHKKKTIDGDISFLSEAEWKAELDILLGDLVDEDGNLKRSTDLKSDAGVAWQKVHAVYPTITQEKLVTMTPDQIIAKDPKIANILGATKSIVARDSKTFAVEINKYIDSKDRKGGKDKKKDKGKERKDKAKEPNSPALWPLIRQVNVRCGAAALSTGAILVDLPGTGDANAARNSIAKEYMKKSNCIWILAPITRAVDDKIAKDLLGEAFRTQLMMDQNYNDSAITFIATKCDDISCSEVISALGLDDDLELEDIQDRIDQIVEETSDCKKKKMSADRLLKAIDQELKETRAIRKEYEEHREALKEGKPFVPRLTAVKSEKRQSTESKKRKNTRGGKEASPKRRRSGSFVCNDDDDDDERMGSSDEEDLDPDAEDSDSSNDSGSESDNDDKESDAENEDDKDSNDEQDSDVESIHDAEEEVTEEFLKGKIVETEDKIKDARERQSEMRKQKKEANDALATLKQKAAAAQKEKNAFCSLKRSESSRGVLKEDFRAGLKDLDDAAAEQRDPANFDPSVSLRDYDAIDLPVFTTSSRDYVRIKKQVKGDGDPTCFSNVEDTGIPELQQWCHALTKSSRERAAERFLQQAVVFANGVKDYVAGIGDVTAADRDSLKDRWETCNQEVGDVGQLNEEDPFAAILGGGGLYTMSAAVPQPRVDRYGEPIGITPRLIREFGKVVETSVSQLKNHLRDGLEERCRVGALNAAGAAVPTSDEFASSMHWASYRATLRRNGEYRRDLNVELVNPFTRNIAQKWQEVFEADVFSSLLTATIGCVNKLIDDVERSAAPGLKDRAKLQGVSCLEEARVTLDKTVETVKETLNTEQKEVSRSLAPHVQGQLLDGYTEAMEHRGKGSVARQKASFHDYITDVKDDIFDGGADVIMERLTDAAEAIGKALDVAMDNLAQKIEVNLAVLWEGVREDPAQVMVRSEVVTEVNQIIDQLNLFVAAGKSRHDEDADMP
ncbi:hypothetical protein DFH07DRAFT_25631 [Mycena maculata]|uniref:Nuclear GTPase SLIP-GC n=1 Tax=Mycena maculata TaxID=230809 RepID=A0AAD7IM17_9AGAR|nr:hypothetical protein DFH07DRAFT_25631 [Mycena maculata]